MINHNNQILPLSANKNGQLFSNFFYAIDLGITREGPRKNDGSYYSFSKDYCMFKPALFIIPYHLGSLLYQMRK